MFYSPAVLSSVVFNMLGFYNLRRELSNISNSNIAVYQHLTQYPCEPLKISWADHLLHSRTEKNPNPPSWPKPTKSKSLEMLQAKVKCRFSTR